MAPTSLAFKAPCSGLLGLSEQTWDSDREGFLGGHGTSIPAWLGAPGQGGPEWSSAGPKPALPTAGLRSLRLLVLHSNLLASVPTGLARLPLLIRLDLRDNQLREVPPELLDAPFVRLQGNPLGEALPDSHSPPGELVAGEGQTTDRTPEPSLH